MQVHGTLTSPMTGMVMDDSLIRGGYKVVADDAAMAALKAQTIKDGTQVYVLSTQKLYRRTAGVWTRVLFNEIAIGDIRISAVTLNEPGWALCNGALLNIAQYPEAFAKFGTKWGGNGTTTFGLPTADERTIIGTGVKTLGAVGGANSVTLTTAQLPAHAHTTSVAIPAVNANGTTDTPGTSVIMAKITSLLGLLTGYSTAAATTTLKPFNATSGNTGTGAAVDITPKFLALNVYIFIGPTT